MQQQITNNINVEKRGEFMENAKDTCLLEQERITELEKEVERLKNTEMALLDAIADFYYSHPNPQGAENLILQYENFLTFGQGGANFLESQLVELQDQN